MSAIEKPSRREFLMSLSALGGSLAVAKLAELGQPSIVEAQEIAALEPELIAYPGEGEFAEIAKEVRSIPKPDWKLGFVTQGLADNIIRLRVKTQFTAETWANQENDDSLGAGSRIEVYNDQVDGQVVYELGINSSWDSPYDSLMYLDLNADTFPTPGAYTITVRNRNGVWDSDPAAESYVDGQFQGNVTGDFGEHSDRILCFNINFDGERFYFDWKETAKNQVNVLDSRA